MFSNYSESSIKKFTYYFAPPRYCNSQAFVIFCVATLNFFFKSFQWFDGCYIKMHLSFLSFCNFSLTFSFNPSLFDVLYKILFLVFCIILSIAFSFVHSLQIYFSWFFTYGYVKDNFLMLFSTFWLHKLSY